MPLEAQDLNDNAILQATKQERNERGDFQFTVSLPSGRLLRSEWIAQDNAKTAMFNWLEAVRQQAVADAAEASAKAQRVMPALTGEERPSANTTQSTPTASAHLESYSPSPASVDPIEYARERVEFFVDKVDYLQSQIAVLTMNLESADKQHRQWTKILSSLTEVENV